MRPVNPIMPPVTPVLHVILWRRPVAGDGLHTAIDRVTVPTLLGHANVHMTVQDDRRGERAKT